MKWFNDGKYWFTHFEQHIAVIDEANEIWWIANWKLPFFDKGTKKTYMVPIAQLFPVVEQELRLK